MSRGLKKEQIIEVTLELIKDKENVRSVNLREIARRLGCAHTNLYNYYSDLDGILWDALDEVLRELLEYIQIGITEMKDDEAKLKIFFTRFVEFYLENRGWFKLSWFEKLNGPRPQKNFDLTVYTVDVFTNIIIDLLRTIDNKILKQGEAKYLLHNVHCYMHGEVSIFLAERGIIKEKDDFKKYVVDQCVKMVRLLS